jgi:opacity protein-like surface antigen
VDWFSASVGDYSGGLWDVAVGAQFQISDHFGVGAEYGYFDLDGKIKDTNWNGKAEISTTGPQLFFTANW